MLELHLPDPVIAGKTVSEHLKAHSTDGIEKLPELDRLQPLPVVPAWHA